MRLWMTLVLGLVLLGSAYSQQKPESGQQKPEATQQTWDLEPTLTNPITRADVLRLGQLHNKPEVSLQGGLRMAEKFIRKEKINMTSCNLMEGKLLFGTPPEKPNWRFWWACSRDAGQTLVYLKIGVSMQGVARRID